MKKLLCLLLAVTMLMGSLFVLSACDEKDKDKDDDKSTEAPGNSSFQMPEGYVIYENDDISFAYPEGWQKSEMGMMVMLVDMTTGNNITLVYQEKSDIYTTMDVAGFNQLLKPSYESAGMAVSDVKVSQVKNSGNFSVTKISYKATQGGNNFNQLMVVIQSGEYDYIVTVTEGITTPADGLLDTVFNSLKAKK